MMQGHLSEREAAALGRAVCVLEQSQVYLNRKVRCTVSQVRAMARRVPDLALVIVDYLGLLRPEQKTNIRYEEVTRLSGDLKALAMQLQVPVLALAQLNRANEARSDKRPSLSDLRDSGALEQDADGVLFLHREDYYEREPDDTVPMQIILAKNRHAGTGEVTLAFQKSTSSFLEVKPGDP